MCLSDAVGCFTSLFEFFGWQGFWPKMDSSTLRRHLYPDMRTLQMLQPIPSREGHEMVAENVLHADDERFLAGMFLFVFVPTIVLEKMKKD